ncbi:MAG TPA: ATP-binding protein [Puia sp.]|nr:ATP-binding protein [Puia sp.]
MEVHHHPGAAFLSRLQTVDVLSGTDQVLETYLVYFLNLFGLGLSLSYEMVKAHGGEINLETKEGEGTTASIILNY